MFLFNPSKLPLQLPPSSPQNVPFSLPFPRVRLEMSTPAFVETPSKIYRGFPSKFPFSFDRFILESSPSAPPSFPRNCPSSLSRELFPSASPEFPSRCPPELSPNLPRSFLFSFLRVSLEIVHSASPFSFSQVFPRNIPFSFPRVSLEIAPFSFPGCPLSFSLSASPEFPARFPLQLPPRFL